MAVNRDKPELWDGDIEASVDFYNNWYTSFAPMTFEETRIETAEKVSRVLRLTNYLTNLSPEVLQNNPDVLPILTMATCPPIARDRLVGLADVNRNLVKCMEDTDARIPPRMDADELKNELEKISRIINRMLDPDIFSWVYEHRDPQAAEAEKSASIIADRLCGAIADTIIRNAQEKRQIDSVTTHLEALGYSIADDGTRYNEMHLGTFSFHTNIPVYLSDTQQDWVNIPVDIVIMPRAGDAGEIPILIEAKSAGDFTNVNKRRKEEAIKMQQLKRTYGETVNYSLLLCGYFNTGYLEYEAAEGIDWIWEHRLEEIDNLGL